MEMQEIDRKIRAEGEAKGMAKHQIIYGVFVAKRELLREPNNPLQALGIGLLAMEENHGDLY